MSIDQPNPDRVKIIEIEEKIKKLEEEKKALKAVATNRWFIFSLLQEAARNLHMQRMKEQGKWPFCEHENDKKFCPDCKKAA